MEVGAVASLRRPLRRAAALVVLEGAGLAAVGLAYAGRAVLGSPESRAGALLGAAIIVGAGVLLVALARALDQRRAWARTPVVVVQLLGLLTAFSLAQGSVWAAAAVAAALSAGTLQALLTAEARTAFDPPAPPPSGHHPRS